MLLLDQRGTGHSSPIHAEALAGCPPGAGALPRPFSRRQHGAGCRIRSRGAEPGSPLEPARPELRRFCSLTYLSLFPDSLHEVYLTGGVAPLVAARTGLPRHLPAGGGQEPRLLHPLPHAQAIANRLATTCTTTTCACPAASALTVEQLQQQGLDLRGQRRFEELYYLLEDAFIGERLNPAFLYQVGCRPCSRSTPTRCSPYCTNPSTAKAAPATGRPSRSRGAPRAQLGTGQGFRLHRRDDLPWMFEQFRELIPLKEAAHLLAQKADWGPSTIGRNWPATGCRWPAPSMPRTCTWSLTTAATLCGAWQQPRLDHQRARAQRPAGRWRTDPGPAHPA